MQTIRIILFVLCNIVVVTLAENRNSNRRTDQSETRIKLPSDIAFTHESGGDIEGEPCYNLLRKVNGVCLLPNQCPEAIKDFKKGIQPQICNYKGHLPIICCPRPKVISTPQPPPPPAPLTTKPPSPVSNLSPSSFDSTNVRRISAQKCAEYMNLTTEVTVVTTLSLNPENRPVKKSKCVKSGTEGFIVGGTKTEAGEFAHMAAIGWREEDNVTIAWNCGGSLISYRYVVSAAHCNSFRGIKPSIIRLGDQNLRKSDDDDQVQEFTIEQSFRHPNYKTSSKYDDIMLFKLDRDIQPTDFVRPACLWQTFDLNYTTAIATGWGFTRDRGQPSDELLKVSLHITSNERCNTFFQRFQALKNGIIDTQLCAGDDHEEKDTCNGDSGGPIQIATPNSVCSYHLIGITSFGKGCGNGYGVYTRVSEYLDWIESVVW